MVQKASGGCRTGKEYVSGVYFPKQRRVVLQGSHKNSAGAHVIGCVHIELPAGQFVEQVAITCLGNAAQCGVSECKARSV